MQETPFQSDDIVIKTIYEPGCTYNVQALPEDEAHKCGKKAIKHADGRDLDMYYCKKHWAVAEERVVAISTVTDV